MRKNKFNIIIYLIISIVIIVAIGIWICLLLGMEKGTEESWAIGVGLFGSLSGGFFSLIAIYITMSESQKNQREILKNNRLQAINYNIDNTMESLTIMNELMNMLISISENQEGCILTKQKKQELIELITILQDKRILLFNEILEEQILEVSRISFEELDKTFYNNLKVEINMFEKALESLDNCKNNTEKYIKKLIEERMKILIYGDI
ncbi:hypothetical protein [Clostridium butyricum]|uniref:hypothetical protein n=1 Tax=Clostridium butyricum TaxID=1492 RepID=UPI0013D03D70|nr:hypothetical protein [Clostridium butyricum]MCQ2016795.1 hypothetical protein [Clostridium butyricum]MCQ2022598.1 hypothetical protein [Clostridium butyricum]NFB69551.1 hypothetical protein [Clostridium butyricum]NFB90394.1 hypothetical protein [Clostridium butyricum]UTY54139.1 hypothetical protein HNS01_13920 [Clostridium butyricum]